MNTGEPGAHLLSAIQPLLTEGLEDLLVVSHLSFIGQPHVSVPLSDV